MNPYSTELRHHGILGQRWGKKNGPPYPLDTEDHSASEQKAGWKKSLDNPKQESETKKTKRVSELKMNDPNLKKKIVIGAAVAGTALAVAGGVYLYKSGKLDGLLKNGNELTGEFGLKVKAKEASNFDKAIRDDAKRINKGGLLGNLFLKNRENNCVFCSTDYDLRRRGFDTVAKTSPRGKNADELLLNYKNLDRTAYKLTKSNTDLISQLSQEGEGARGIILGSRGILNGSGGHAFNYEIRNNKVYIIDGQIGKVYDSPNQIYKYLRTQGFHEYAALRTDDKELSDRVLSLVSDSKKGLSNLKGEHLSDLGVNAAATLGVAAVSAASNAYMNYRDNKEYEEYVKSQADRRKTNK